MVNVISDVVVIQVITNILEIGLVDVLEDQNLHLLLLNIAEFDHFDDVLASSELFQNLDFSQNFAVSDRFQNFYDHFFVCSSIHSFVYFWVFTPAEWLDDLEMLEFTKARLKIGKIREIEITKNRKKFKFLCHKSRFLPPLWLEISVIEVLWSFLDASVFVRDGLFFLLHFCLFAKNWIWIFLEFWVWTKFRLTI